MRQMLTNTAYFALALKLLTLTAAVTALYFQDLSMIFNDALYSEATNYILAIPLLLAYLVYRKRRMLNTAATYQPANQSKSTKQLTMLCGALLCTMAMILYWHGSSTFTPLEYHMYTLPVFAAGLTLLLFNFQTLRQAAFPIAFLLFLTPPPLEIMYGFGSTLAVISSEASSAIVRLLGVPATLSGEYGNPTVIITRPDQTRMSFTVDIACSGIYSLISFFIFAAFIAYITRDKTWKKTTIFLLGLPLIYLLNITRLTTIWILGYYYGEELALQVFHLLGGWILLFLGALILLTATEKLFKINIFTKTHQPPPCTYCIPQSTVTKNDFCFHCGRQLRHPKPKLDKTGVAKALAIILAVILLLSIQTPVFALTQGPAQLIVQTPSGEQGNTKILPQIPGYNLEFIYRDKSFEQTAKQDASLVYTYTPSNQTKDAVWVSVEAAQTRSSLHRWEACLITWPQTHGYTPKVTQNDLRDVQLLQNPPIIGRYFAFTYMNYNQTQLVLYWFETSFFNSNGTTQQKQVKVSLITYPEPQGNITEAENYLLPFGTAIASYWEPMKTWTQISLLLSGNSETLAVTTGALLAITILYQAILERRRRRGYADLYEKLSANKKLVFDAINQTKTTPTLQNITESYATLTNKPETPDTLYQKLDNAQETGLVEKRIASRDDMPIQTWKANFKQAKRNASSAQEN